MKGLFHGLLVALILMCEGGLTAKVKMFADSLLHERVGKQYLTLPFDSFGLW